MCFCCCWFCCADEEEDDLVYSRLRRRSSAKTFEIPPTADTKCISFLEQVRAKGVTTYERIAHRQHRRYSPNAPLLHTTITRSPCDKKAYLAFARPSISLSDVSEKTEESLSLSFTASGDANMIENGLGIGKAPSAGSMRHSSSASSVSLRDSIDTGLTRRNGNTLHP